MKNNNTPSKGLFLFVFLAIITLISISTEAMAGEYVSVKKDGVNIRSGPSTNNEILWEVFKDFPLEVVKKKDNWYQTKDFEGDTGWIYQPLTSTNKTVIVKVNTANMRVGPSKNYEVIATVKYGVVFEPKEKEGDWIKVHHEDGTTGWIFNTLIWPSDPL